ncbi:uncharacterized protein N7469_005793 [Penicillium citrinum]|uniref:C3H1-type domain-containing protein n=1 Tax=Penicillium citrinum TaxID=5077 RepID=A0A9W9P4P8_PENCI|nr:uncharacterized protein N7469_005793 [Penicillium citrinum]KAJ5234027.1 hypothetical protein N7469_005793 [Penicillium citrinum]
MYSDPQLQAQQQDAPSQQPPTGITWDHPIFAQSQPQSQPQPQPQPHQRNHLPPQTDASHGMYSSLPQSWQPNPLQQPSGGYTFSSQLPPQQQVPQYQQSQISFDSRSLTPSESSAFPSYSYQQSFFNPQQLSVQDPFPERTAQHQQQSEFQNIAPRASIPQFPLNPSYQPEIPTIDLTNDFPSAETINPQFLNPNPQTPGQNQSHQQIPNNYLYGVQAEYPQSDGRMFDYYQNNFSVQPPAVQQATRMQTLAPRGANGLAVIVPPPSETSNKKPPAKKRGRPKKTASKPKQSQSGSDSDSSDYESDLEIEPPDEPSPIPPVRPSDTVDAAKYDTMQAVWSPRNKRVPADKVKSALVTFPKIIKTLRDAWKDQVQAMKLAENQGDNDKAMKIKKDVALQRQVMDVIVRTALDVGHPMIVEKLGEHPIALAAIYSFLADRFQATDFEGSLTVNLLKLLERFVTVDEELLQKTNLSKILPRFLKKGGSSSKELAQRIMDNASASSKRKQSNAKTGKEESAAKGDSSSEIAGSKRAREGENNTHPAPKKMVVTSNPKDASKSAQPPNMTPKAGLNGKAAANSAAPRPRPAAAAPKLSSLFGSLSSASKRPGTTNAERAAAAAAAAKTGQTADKKEKQAPPPSKPAFSLNDIMADLSKPKEAPVAKPAEERPPETEEERQKRIRKESRRKLRVTWKPDDSLTEVRLFTHDPEEELRPGDSSLRGVGDVKGEGSVLKLHKDLEDLEEDDLGGIREISLQDYTALTAIDLDLGDLKTANFIKRGGEQIPESPETEAQEHREATTLMAFYTSPADVPPSPKEPPASETDINDESAPELVSFGDVPEHVKARQERYFAHVNPPVTAPAAQPEPAAPAAGGFDISHLLKLIGTGNQQQSTPPPQSQPPPPQAPVGDSDYWTNFLRQQQGQPLAPPAPPIPPVSQPQATQEIDFQKIFNVMQQMKQGSAFSQPQSQPGMVPNMGAMMGSQFGEQNNYSDNSSYSHGYEDPERKRMREVGQHDEWSRQKRTKASDPKPYKVGLVPCKFWAEGKCRKGENCTFRHDS